jgi:hypothetical protein
MLIFRPVLVIEYSRLSLTAAPAEPAVNPPEQLELDAADPEVALPTRRIVAVFADRASAFAALCEFRLRFGFAAGTADHLAPRSRRARATA